MSESLQNQTTTTVPVSLRIPEALEAEIKEAEAATHLPKPEVMRQAMRLGLRVLVAALAQPGPDAAAVESSAA